MLCKKKEMPPQTLGIKGHLEARHGGVSGDPVSQGPRSDSGRTWAQGQPELQVRLVLKI